MGLGPDRAGVPGDRGRPSRGGRRPRARRADAHLPLARETAGSPTQAAFHEACQETGLRRHGRPQRTRFDGRRGPAPQPARRACAYQPGHRVPDTRGARPRQPDASCPTPRCAGCSSRTAARRVSWPRRGVARPRTRRARSSWRPAPWPVRICCCWRASGPRRTCARWASRSCADVPGVGVGVRDHPKAWTQWRLRDGLGLEANVPVAPALGALHRDGSDLRGDMMLYPNSVVPGRRPGHGRLPHRGGQQPPAVGRSPVAACPPTRRSSRPSTSRCCRSRVTAPAWRRPSTARIALGRVSPLREMLLAPGPAGPDGPRQRCCPGRLRRPDGHDRPAHLEQLPHGSRRRPDGRRRRARPRPRRRRACGSSTASIMPDSVRANIHATVLAMAWLMASRIDGRGSSRMTLRVDAARAEPAGGRRASRPGRRPRSRPCSRCATSPSSSGPPRRSTTSPWSSTAARSTPCWARTAPASRR